MVSLGSQGGLGIGLYTPAQAARLARISTKMMQRWIHGTTDGDSALRAQLAKDPDRSVTFLDFVQAMAIRAIRLEHKVSLQKIREFVDRAEGTFGVSYPFARKHQTYLFDDDIVVRHGDDLIQLTGKYKNQDLIRPVAELFMQDLSFAKTGLAESYRPLVYGPRYIQIDPRHRMGQPLVMPCGYSVQAILHSVKSEGSIPAAAKAGEIDEADVYLALRYDDLLRGIAA